MRFSQLLLLLGAEATQLVTEIFSTPDPREKSRGWNIQNGDTITGLSGQHVQEKQHENRLKEIYL